jgi:hypothetical protein
METTTPTPREQELDAQNKALRQALSWYGYGGNYCQPFGAGENALCPIMQDDGKIAREALGVSAPYDSALEEAVAAIQKAKESR